VLHPHRARQRRSAVRFMWCGRSSSGRWRSRC
jgi:hypothetical protein